MIIVLKPNVTKQQIDYIMERVKGAGLQPHLSTGVERSVICVIGDERSFAQQPIETIPGVERVIPILKPFKLASRDYKNTPTTIQIDGVNIGGGTFVVIAGPCSVESYSQLHETAKVVKSAGAHILRAGAYKPRTSPYTFQGLGEQALVFLSEIKREIKLPVITEVMDVRDLDKILEVADIVQIGARNMQNFSLLKEVGKLNIPILIKRGMSSTITELLMAAEYVMVEGNCKVILCERGIKTFNVEYTRNTLDISAVPVVKELSHLPIIVDPSHAGGRWWLVEPLAKAAVAVGADGVMIEVHPNPKEALSDGEQSLDCEKFFSLMETLKRLVFNVGARFA